MIQPETDTTEQPSLSGDHMYLVKLRQCPAPNDPIILDCELCRVQ